MHIQETFTNTKMANSNIQCFLNSNIFTWGQFNQSFHLNNFKQFAIILISTVKKIDNPGEQH